MSKRGRRYDFFLLFFRIPKTKYKLQNKWGDIQDRGSNQVSRKNFSLIYFVIIKIGRLWRRCLSYILAKFWWRQKLIIKEISKKKNWNQVSRLHKFWILWKSKDWTMRLGKMEIHMYISFRCSKYFHLNNSKILKHSCMIAIRDTSFKRKKFNFLKGIID